MRTKIFFDTEFTGLNHNTTLISIGLVAQSGETFYAELTDYDRSQVNDWIRENVIDKLKFNPGPDDHCIGSQFLNGKSIKYSSEIVGNTEALKRHLTSWLAQFGEVELWSDCLPYDWVLFNHIFGSAFDIPENVYYIPFDICTLFWALAVDPDVSREAFSGMKNGAQKHNALWDAMVIKGCFDKLTSRMNDLYSVVHPVDFEFGPKDPSSVYQRDPKHKGLFGVDESKQLSGNLVVKGEMHLNDQTVEYDLNLIKIVNGPMIAESGNQCYGISKVERVDTSDKSKDVSGEFGNDEF